MGRKKVKRKLVKRKPEKLQTSFQCPFCNYDHSVEVTFDKDRNLASIFCSNCKEIFQATTTRLFHLKSSNVMFQIELTKPIDVYCKWIDACEDANQ